MSAKAQVGSMGLSQMLCITPFTALAWALASISPIRSLDVSHRSQAGLQTFDC